MFSALMIFLGGAGHGGAKTHNNIVKRQKTQNNQGGAGDGRIFHGTSWNNLKHIETSNELELV